MQRLDFRLTGEFIALNDLLKTTYVCGAAGCTWCDCTSESGEYHGAVELRKTCKVRPGQTVRVGDVRIAVLGPAPA
jgi:ribosome-associated protein